MARKDNYSRGTWKWIGLDAPATDEDLEKLYAALLTLPDAIIKTHNHVDAQLEGIHERIEDGEEFEDDETLIRQAAWAAADNFHDGDRDDRLIWLNDLLDSVADYEEPE